MVVPAPSALSNKTPQMRVCICVVVVHVAHGSDWDRLMLTVETKLKII